MRFSAEVLFSRGFGTAVVRRQRVLNEGPVHFALLKRLGHVHLLPGERMLFRIVHARREGHGQGGEVLHLLGSHAPPLEVCRKVLFVLDVAPGRALMK